MTSKIKVDNINKVSDDSTIIKKCGSTTTVGSGAGNTIVVCGSTVTMGRCGGTVALASGASQTGFGREGSVNWQTGSIKTGDFTAANGEGYFVDTSSGAIIVTFPSSPSAGNIIAFSDYARNFGNNKLTLNRNGQPIGGLAQNGELNVTGQASTFVYVDGTQGWINVQNAEDTETGTNPYVTASGGTVATCGDFKIHTFTSPGTFCVSAAGTPGGSTTIDYLVVAGGGAGGSDNGGGGGAGGVRFSDGTFSNGPAPSNPRGCTSSQPVSQQSYPVTIGAGGAVAPCAGKGSDSVFAGTTTITSTGGGGGGKDGSTNPLSPGGSGGGAGQNPSTQGSGNTPPVSPSQGSDGGPQSPSTSGGGSGGGGFMAAGSQSPGTAGGGAAGAGGGFIPTAFGPSGVTCGSFKYYGGGGGGGAGQPGGGGPGAAGVGGGGAGGPGTSDGTSGTANTGGGAGGGGQGGAGGTGGSGIVVIRYKFQN